MSGRNRIAIGMCTRYDSTTGRPYKRWSASCQLSVGGWHGAEDQLVRDSAVRQLLRRLQDVRDAADRAIKKLQAELAKENKS